MKLLEAFKTIRSLTMVMGVTLSLITVTPSMAEGTASEPAAASAVEAEVKSPTVEERLADIEAYMNNVDRPKKASGAESLVKGPGPGANAWQMVSTALVIFMTLPGLALFYGGLVRQKNVLSVLGQCLAIACVVTPLWWLCGYSLSFGAGNAIIGDLKMAFLTGLDPAACGAGYYWISDSVWSMFQLSFAIITPALIIGAIAERMRFAAVLVFVLLWMFAVYFPFAHMVWSPTGLMCGPLNQGAWIKAVDFAGGTVVHMTSGWSALILCMILGKRRGHGKELMAPHSMVLCVIGTGMLWVGWYGFNAGSALGADAIAANAFTTTTLAAGTAGLTWGGAEWFMKGKASVLGFCSGILAGLVVITPAAGFVTPTSAVMMALIGGIVPFAFVTYLKKYLPFDDALDAFGVHGIGGTLGALLTGVFASEKVNSVLAPLSKGLMLEQVKACAIAVGWSVIATAVIALVLKKFMGLRVDPEIEVAGIDLAEHGEVGYEQ